MPGSKDTLKLFHAEVERWEDKFRAYCPDFPRVEAYGDTPEEAVHHLKRMILEVWFSFRSR